MGIRRAVVMRSRSKVLVIYSRDRWSSTRSRVIPAIPRPDYRSRRRSRGGRLARIILRRGIIISSDYVATGIVGVVVGDDDMIMMGIRGGESSSWRC